MSALVVQDRFGGDLLRGTVGRVSHYFNRLPDGSIVDLTREQFPHGSTIEDVKPTSREYVLSVAATRRRYARLQAAVGRARGQE